MPNPAQLPARCCEHQAPQCEQRRTSVMHESLWLLSLQCRILDDYGGLLDVTKFSSNMFRADSADSDNFRFLPAPVVNTLCHPGWIRS